MRDSYDCIVIGGGPAGSTAAALIAQQGVSTLLVERDKMPRFHVGESLMPETYWTFQRLGVLDKMRNSQFVKKYSVQFISGSGKESQPFYFSEHDPRDCSQTWQVERAGFDQMLFENAAEQGAECHDQTRVSDVLFDGQRATGVRLRQADGQEQEIQCRVVIDGSGQHSLIAHRLGLRQPIPALRKAAVWGYFRGAERLPDEHGGATLILHTNTRKAWFWYIPLSDDITSVGVVSDVEYLLKDRGAPADVYCEELGNCPALQRRVAEAKMEGELHVAKEFSYTTRQHAGDGWVLIGDAFGFIDPIYSSGVFLALKSGELAADAVVEGLRNNRLTGAQLGNWTEEFKQGVHWIHRLVTAFYTDNFSFGMFMKEHPHHQGNLTDLLIGRVFHPEAGEMFTDMDPYLRQSAAKTGMSASG